MSSVKAKIEQSTAAKAPLDPTALFLPFTDEIMKEPPPQGFVYNSTSMYDGTTNPNDHLKYFNTIASMGEVSDAYKCRLFPSTLNGEGKDWFNDLPRNSITCFKDLALKFLECFAHQTRVRYIVTHLSQVVQVSREPFSDYLTRYVRAVRLIPDITQNTAIFALVQNMNHEEFKNHLIKKPPATLTEALADAQQFIHFNNI